MGVLPMQDTSHFSRIPTKLLYFSDTVSDLADMELCLVLNLIARSIIGKKLEGAFTELFLHSLTNVLYVTKSGLVGVRSLECRFEVSFTNSLILPFTRLCLWSI